MAQSFELSLEVPVFSPDKPAEVGSQIREAIREAALDSGLAEVVGADELEPRFAQSLPSKGDIEIVKAVVAFAIQEAPKVWPYLQAFLERLRARLQGTASAERIKAEISIGSRKIRFEGFTKDDEFAAAIGETDKVLRISFGPHP